MSLTKLDVVNFRNLASATLAPIPRGFNLIYGQNGSGKTSLLEAIYYLSLGRSFRSSVMSRIIRETTDKLSLFAQILTSQNQAIPLGIERQQNSAVKIRIAGRDADSIAELAQLTPVLLINPNCYHLLDGGPVFRRKYLDWGMFYQQKDFLRVWRQYERILKQRNAALQGRRSKKEIDIWTKDLVETANLFNSARETYVGQLFPLLTETLASLITLPDLGMSYYPGWDTSRPFEAILEEGIGRDIQQGFTQFGPHRADLKITLNQAPAKDILSRGQQKLFVCAMMLAQGALLRSCANQNPIYLVDDLPSELDVVSRSNLIALLSRQEAQVFVTAIEHDALGALMEAPTKVFHVEHGHITEVT